MITIIFDTETTGLAKPKATSVEEQPYVTELFALKVGETNGHSVVLDQYEQMFHVPIPLSKEITRITGITDADLKDKPTFGEAFDDLAEFFKGSDRMVAHNLAFDRSMIANELVRCDKLLKFAWPRDHICTVEKSMTIEQRRMSLTNLHKWFFRESFNAHRAKDDVLALFKCYKEMVKRGMIT